MSSQGPLVTPVVAAPETGAATAVKLAKGERRRGAAEGRRALLVRCGILLGFFGLWELLAALGVLDARYVSRPSSVVGALIGLSGDERVHTAIIETLGAFLAAFVIGTLLGGIVGLVFGLQRLLRDAFYPVILLLMSVPKTVFLPLIVLFFGLGTEAGVVFGALLAFVHVTVNVVAGIDLVESKYYTVARAYDASRSKLFLHVLLPGAAPGIFAAIWHGIRNGFVGVVIAQMFVSTAGIGYLVRVYSNNFQTDQAMALVLVTALMVIIAGTAWNRLESSQSAWKDKQS